MPVIVIPQNRVAQIEPIRIFDVNYNCAINETKVYEDANLDNSRHLFVNVGQATTLGIRIHSKVNLPYWIYYTANLIAGNQYELILGVQPLAVELTLHNTSGAAGGWSVWWYALQTA